MTFKFGFVPGTISFVLGILALAPAVSLAADGSSGCGVGWYILKENSLLSSSSRNVTNAVLPNTFSMTSGTSNCAKHSIVQNDKKGLHFVESNADSLEINIAAGEGQFVEGFAFALGCAPEVMPQFAGALQSRYKELFPNPSASSLQSNGSQELYLRIKGVLFEKGDIVHKCTALSSQS
jgi:hypothetical protein